MGRTFMFEDSRLTLMSNICLTALCGKYPGKRNLFVSAVLMSFSVVLMSSNQTLSYKTTAAGLPGDGRKHCAQRSLSSV